MKSLEPQEPTTCTFEALEIGTHFTPAKDPETQYHKLDEEFAEGVKSHSHWRFFASEWVVPQPNCHQISNGEDFPGQKKPRRYSPNGIDWFNLNNCEEAAKCAKIEAAMLESRAE